MAPREGHAALDGDGGATRPLLHHNANEPTRVDSGGGGGHGCIETCQTADPTQRNDPGWRARVAIVTVATLLWSFAAALLLTLSIVDFQRIAGPASVPPQDPTVPGCGPWCHEDSIPRTEKCRLEGEFCRPGHGVDFCLSDCGSWRDFADTPVPRCTCERFCRSECWAPSCVPCSRECLPVWIRDTPEPLGLGILCCPDCLNPCDPCCSSSHSELGRCCQLVDEPEGGCDCNGSNDGPPCFRLIAARVLEDLLVPAALLIPATAALLAWSGLCRSLWLPLLRFRRAVLWPRQLLFVGVLACSLSLQALWKKRRWDLSGEPKDLTWAAITGSWSILLIAISAAPAEVTWRSARAVRIHLPFDQAVAAHRFTGAAGVASALLHGLLEALCFFRAGWEVEVASSAAAAAAAAAGRGAPVPLGVLMRKAASGAATELLAMRPQPWGLGNLFGLLAGLALALLAGSAALRRRGYALFLATHRASAVAALVLISLHRYHFAPAAAALLLWHASLHLRRALESRTVELSCRVLCSSSSRSRVAFLEAPLAIPGSSSPVRCPPGSWFLVKIPSLDGSWHPFSNGSATDEGRIAMLCKPSGSPFSWSWRLCDLVSSLIVASSSSADSEPFPAVPMDACILGPYGRVPERVARCRRVLLVAGGSGITGVISTFIHRRRTLGKSSVQMFWVTTEAESLEWLKELLLGGVDVPVGDAVEDDVWEDSAIRQCNEVPRIREQGGGGLSVHITSALSSHCASSSVDEADKEETLMLPGFVQLMQGRPDLSAVLESFAAADSPSMELPDSAEERSSGAVVVCGPEAMVRDVIKHCPGGLLVHSEEFQW